MPNFVSKTPAKNGQPKKAWPSKWAIILGLAASLSLMAMVFPMRRLAATRDANELLRGLTPGFDSDCYRPVEFVQSADGRYWRVRLDRVAGSGPEKLTVSVPVRWAWLPRFL